MQAEYSPVKISRNFIEQHTEFKSLIDELALAFAANDVIVPQRHHHDFPNENGQHSSTMLLMPAWSPGLDAGVKVVTVSPGNSSYGLPSVQGSYLYLDAQTGCKKADIEASSLTAYRTAAASALASSMLSDIQASTLLMVGTGRLAVPLILAHKAVRNLQKVLVWGRNRQRADQVVQQLQGEEFTIESVSTLREALPMGDIVCTATLSAEPLLEGKYLRPGQHLDLVGAFRPQHRESDDDCILRTKLFVDCRDNLHSSGELAIPFSKGLIRSSDIMADLFELCRGSQPGRNSSRQITLFKSVGHALEDLVAARYYYRLYSLRSNKF
ncbi:MAG: ornithine cyclodeaminase family protein [Gammaproteobacteria bacterium]|nr:ornithine cyclodeaminase family protein [Gammaproteobacteria bacterium]MCY4358658.1 ornithine cyclodeaminase family protein [Gammaproteobacteria bacterium]